MNSKTSVPIDERLPVAADRTRMAVTNLPGSTDAEPARPIASVSLDLDNQWSYFKTQGKPWQDYPTYLPLVIPRILDWLRRRRLQITFFIVGRDAEFSVHHPFLRMIADEGHEVGNHSLEHDPGFHQLPPRELLNDFERSEAAIFAATGHRPIGFRGPNFTCSQNTLRVLNERGYEYDGSSLPSFIGPAARTYLFLRSCLSRQQRAERRALFGRFRDGFGPLRPFAWDVSSSLIEIPVTTIPIIRAPFHMSYLNFLAQFHPRLARFYFRRAIEACRLFRVAPSFLLHPLDFLGGDELPEFHFFPGMKQSTNQKMVLLDDVFDRMQERFRLVPMREHARRVRAAGLRRRSPTSLPDPPIRESS